MNNGQYVLNQVVDGIHRQTLKRCVDRYEGNQRVRHFGCRQQFICMLFAQMTWRESLRDIEICLNANPSCLYHLGFKEAVARSTLAEANEKRDWRIWRDLTLGLIAKARKLYSQQAFAIELENTLYALDSTTIDLSLSLFPWARFRQTKAGIKIHTQIDLRGPIPTMLEITEARWHDVHWLDHILIETGAFYVMDRGYIDFKRLYSFEVANAFFVIRAKDNLLYSRQTSNPVDYSKGICSDQIVLLGGNAARRDYPSKLRKIRYFDKEKNANLVFLTNHMHLPAITIARLYKMRWQVELFFKWIKQNLKIKHFYGNSQSAVKTQIWIAAGLYVLIAIIHKNLNLSHSLSQTLQLLSVHPFENMPLHQLLTNVKSKTFMPLDSNQLLLFDL